MKLQKNENTNAELTIWLILQSIVVIIASVISFLFVEFISKYILKGNQKEVNSLLYALVGVVPMCAILGALNYYLSKMMYSYVIELANGLEKISKGNFNTRLISKKPNPILAAYENFNLMAEELQNVQALHNDFINNYSHEFKTPITSINGFAELLLEENVSEEDKKMYLKIIVEESARLATLANSTMLLSRLNAQRIIPDRKTYSLDEQIRQCAILLSPEWTAKKIEFSGNLQQILYEGNSELMQHLWINLIQNAIKFTPENGEISISLEKNEDALIVKVTDSGVGMSDEIIKHIFDEYYQGETARSAQGLGLGLSIVKRIVELCGADIKVESAINTGSSFILTFPLNQSINKKALN